MRRAAFRSALALVLCMPLALAISGVMSEAAQAAVKAPVMSSGATPAAPEATTNHRVAHNRSAPHRTVKPLATPPAVAIYDSTPPEPGTTTGNIASVGFQDASASEFGNQITFANAGTLTSVEVTMSSWACENQTAPGWDSRTAPGACNTPTYTDGTAYNAGGACEYTAPYCAGDTFSEPITLKIYNVGPGDSVGGLILSVPQTFNIPYRPPSNNTECNVPAPSPAADLGDWFDPATSMCYSGLANNITFNVPPTQVSGSVIWSVSYNTTSSGYSPYGTQPCNAVPLVGCPYDSLNVGINLLNAPNVGSDPLPGTIYWNTSNAGFYCDGGAGGVSTFRLDSPGPPSLDACWEPGPDGTPPYYVPAAEFDAIPLTSANEFYVEPKANGGNDEGGTNNCLLLAKPCATIEHAIDEAAMVAPNAVGAVIDLLKGTFNSGSDTMFAGLGSGANADLNNNLTITGTTNKKGILETTVDPQNCSALGVVTDPGSPDAGYEAMAVFDAPDGIASESIGGVTIENINLDGGAVAGGTCPAYQAGVINTSGEDNAVVGVTLQSGATYGILTDDDANSTIISNVLTPVLCSTVVTGPNTGLNAGWTTPANLKVKADPKCAKFVEAGHAAATAIVVNGLTYCMTTSATKLVLAITGTPTPGTGCADGGTPIIDSVGQEIATGATVTYNTSTAPFTHWGIACNSPVGPENQTTDCAISDNTIIAGGTAYGDYPAPGMFPPAGIVVTGGATANIDGNTVSDMTDIYTNPGTGAATSDGIGIGLIPDASGCTAGDSQVGVDHLNSPATGKGNTLSGNDVGIAVSGNSSPGCSDDTPTNPSFELNANTVSSANVAGIALTQLGQTYGGQLDSAIENNSVSGVTAGVAIEAVGINEVTIGGPLSSEGNTESGSGFGLVLAPCTTTSCATESGNTYGLSSSDYLIQNICFTGNIAYGVLAVGSYQVDELAGQIPTALESYLSSTDNTFDANRWGTSTNATNGTLPSEINGSEVEDGTGWAGGCFSETGDCGTRTLVYEGANQTLSSSNPGIGTLTLSLCTTGASEDLPRGTEMTFNTPNAPATPGQETNDGGTFFVTQAAIITGNSGGCASSSNPDQWANVSVQAIAPSRVGTLEAPSGQPYIVGSGDTVFVDANGAYASASPVYAQNFYGTSAEANSCTPADVDQSSGSSTGTLIVTHGAVTTPDVFGETDPPFATYSTTLQASTGGVNATYAAC